LARWIFGATTPAWCDVTAEFVAWSQGADPDKATQDVNFKWADPLFAMFRLGYIFLPQPGNFRVFDVETPPLPHFAAGFEISCPTESRRNLRSLARTRF